MECIYSVWINQIGIELENAEMWCKIVCYCDWGELIWWSRGVNALWITKSSSMYMLANSGKTFDIVLLEKHLDECLYFTAYYILLHLSFCDIREYFYSFERVFILLHRATALAVAYALQQDKRWRVILHHCVWPWNQWNASLCGINVDSIWYHNNRKTW